jgi:hypothetical protein
MNTIYATEWLSWLLKFFAQLLQGGIDVLILGIIHRKDVY